MRLGSLVSLALLLVGCGSSDDSKGGGTGTDAYASARQECVDRINGFRETLGLPPYQRWEGAESCSDSEAASDSQTKKAHGAFGQCGENAQNECPGYGSVDQVLGTCLDQMWAEGPGADFQAHGHYINMSSTNYTMAACGFAEGGSGLWAVQNFK